MCHEELRHGRKQLINKRECRRDAKIRLCIRAWRIIVSRRASTCPNVFLVCHIIACQKVYRVLEKELVYRFSLSLFFFFPTIVFS